MFGDFVALGFDQIVNGIAKFREMFDEQATVPLVVRTPMGGRRGYGPTHSQSLEKFLMGVPGIVVVAAERVPRHRGRCSPPRSTTTGRCSSSRTSSCTAARTGRPPTVASATSSADRRRPVAGADLLRQRLLGRRSDDRRVRRDAADRARRRDAPDPRGGDLHRGRRARPVAAARPRAGARVGRAHESARHRRGRNAHGRRRRRDRGARAGARRGRSCAGRSRRVAAPTASSRPPGRSRRKCFPASTT